MPVYNHVEKRLAKRLRKEEEAQQLSKLLHKLEQAGDGSVSGLDSDSEDEDGDDESESDEGDESDDESIGTLDSEDGQWALKTVQAQVLMPDSSDDDDEEEGSDDDDGSSGDEDEGEEVEGAVEVEGSDEEDDFFTLTNDQVAASPIYALPTPAYPAHSSACVVCPGRIFKNDHILEEHKSSKAHKRAMKRWEERVKLDKSGERPFESDDPRIVVDGILDEVEMRRQVSIVP